MKILLDQHRPMIEELISLVDSNLKILFWNNTFACGYYDNYIKIPFIYPLDSLDVEIDYIMCSILQSDYNFDLKGIPVMILHIYHEIGHYKTRIGKVKDVQLCEELRFDSKLECHSFNNLYDHLHCYMFMCHEKLADIWAINFINDNYNEIIGILKKYNWK